MTFAYAGSVESVQSDVAVRDYAETEIRKRMSRGRSPNMKGGGIA